VIGSHEQLPSVALGLTLWSEPTAQHPSKLPSRGDALHQWREVGHAAQNVFLQAQALNLGTVVIGAFWDRAVKRVLQLPKDERGLYLMPVGTHLHA
jgi:nitroreductase